MNLVKELFDWESTKSVGDLLQGFEQITLNCDIGEFQKGTHFDLATLDLYDGILWLCENGPPSCPPTVLGEFLVNLVVKGFAGKESKE